MLPDKTYNVRFVRNDGKPNEAYLYTDSGFAMMHYNLFASLSEGEVYDSICISEYNWVTKTEKFLKHVWRFNPLR